MLADVKAYDAAKARLDDGSDELIPLEITEHRLPSIIDFIPMPCENHSRSRQRSVCPPPEEANAPCWKQMLFDILDSPEGSLTNSSGRSGDPTTRNRSKTRKS